MTCHWKQTPCSIPNPQPVLSLIITWSTHSLFQETDWTTQRWMRFSNLPKQKKILTVTSNTEVCRHSTKEIRVTFAAVVILIYSKYWGCNLLSFLCLLSVFTLDKTTQPLVNWFMQAWAAAMWQSSHKYRVDDSYKFLPPSARTAWLSLKLSDIEWGWHYSTPLYKPFLLSETSSAVLLLVNKKPGCAIFSLINRLEQTAYLKSNFLIQLF